MHCTAPLQVVFADGTSHVLFPNGDVKISWPSGQVDYYYSEVGSKTPPSHAFTIRHHLQ